MQGLVLELPGFKFLTQVWDGGHPRTVILMYARAGFQEYIYMLLLKKFDVYLEPAGLLQGYWGLFRSLLFNKCFESIVGFEY